MISNSNNIELRKKTHQQKHPRVYEQYDEAEHTSNVNNSNKAAFNTNTNKIMSDQGEIVFIGDGWASFPDLDNFNSDLLLNVLTLKDVEPDEYSIWDPFSQQKQRNSKSVINNPHLSNLANSGHPNMLSMCSLRQLEALFNLTQLLFSLSRADVVNFTFRDLQFSKHPRLFKKSGFKLITSDRKLDFYDIFEHLVIDIINNGGLEVVLLMYRNPILPMVRQKCLDLISNVTTVPIVAQKLLLGQEWFFDHLLIMIRDGDLVSDKIPALSVLIRLLKIILTQRLTSAYIKLVDMQYIDFIVDIFENDSFTTNSDYLPLFIKFECMTMQSLTVILGDREYSELWSDKAKSRLLNYSIIVLLKAVGVYNHLYHKNKQPSQHSSSSSSNSTSAYVNHIYYAEQTCTKHSLAHVIMAITELIRYDANMRLFYKNHKPFKQLIIRLYKKYGVKSKFIAIDPGISYALNHLIRVLYIQNINRSVEPTDSVTPLAAAATSAVSITSAAISSMPMMSSSNQIGRVCSNQECKNEETKYKPFKVCPQCNGFLAAYCSSKCKNAHLDYHLAYNCDNGMNRPKSNAASGSGGISSSASSLHAKIMQSAPSTSRALPISRRASDNFFKNLSEEMQQQQYQHNKMKMPKYKSSLESNGQSSNMAVAGETVNGQFDGIQSRRNSFNMKLTDYNSKQQNQLNTMQPPPVPPPGQHFIKNKPSFIDQATAATISSSTVANKPRIMNGFWSIGKNMTATTSNNSNNNNTDDRIMFARPLKTSTALCLTDLTSNQNKISADQHHRPTTHAAVSRSRSSIVNNFPVPIRKKLKTKSISLEDEANESDDEQTEEVENEESENENDFQIKSAPSSAKSTFSSIYTKTKTIIKTTTTNFKYKKNDIFYRSSNGRPADNHNDDYKNDDEYHCEENHYGGSPSAAANAGSKETLQPTADDEHELQEFISHLCSSDSEKENEENDNDDEDDSAFENTDEIETKRFERSTSKRRSSNLFIKQTSRKTPLILHRNSFKGLSTPTTTSSASTTTYNTTDDDEYMDEKSKFKVIKEFERTVDFVRNASNLKVMNLNDLNSCGEESGGSQQKQIFGGSSGNEDAGDESEEVEEGINANYIMDSLCYKNQHANKEHQHANMMFLGNAAVSNNYSSCVDATCQYQSVYSDDAENRSKGEKNDETEFAEKQRERPLTSGSSIYSLLQPKKNNTHNQNGYIDEEMNAFKSSSNINNNNNSNLRSAQTRNIANGTDDDTSLFKIPSVPKQYNSDETSTNTKLPMSLKPIESQANIVKNKSSKIYTELKVFNNLDSVPTNSNNKNNNNNNNAISDTTKQSLFSTTTVYDNDISRLTMNTANDLPKNSTPIYTDNSSSAYLLAKRKQVFKLDLTVTGPTVGGVQQPLTARKLDRQMIDQIIPEKELEECIEEKRNSAESEYYLPKIEIQSNKVAANPGVKSTVSLISHNGYRLQTPISLAASVQANANNNLENSNKQMSMLDMSKIAAYENATTSSNLVSVAKIQLPKHVKKSIKDEYKKDKSKCSIQ